MAVLLDAIKQQSTSYEHTMKDRDQEDLPILFSAYQLITSGSQEPYTLFTLRGSTLHSNRTIGVRKLTLPTVYFDWSIVLCPV